jgi:hypothetical protein
MEAHVCPAQLYQPAGGHGGPDRIIINQGDPGPEHTNVFIKGLDELAALDIDCTRQVARLVLSFCAHINVDHNLFGRVTSYVFVNAKKQIKTRERSRCRAQSWRGTLQRGGNLRA